MHKKMQLKLFLVERQLKIKRCCVASSGHIPFSTDAIKRTRSRLFNVRRQFWQAFNTRDKLCQVGIGL